MFCGPQSSSSRFTLFHTTTISHWQQIHLLTLTTNILSHIRKYENQPGCRDSADCWKASIIIILQFSNSIIKGKPKTLQCIWWEIILYITVPPYNEHTHFCRKITHFCREIRNHALFSRNHALLSRNHALFSQNAVWNFSENSSILRRKGIPQFICENQKFPQFIG